MLKLLPYVDRFLTSDIVYENTEQYRKIILINSILFFATIIFTVFGFYNLSVDKTLIASLDFIAGTLTAGAIIDLRINKNVGRAGEIGIWTLFLFFISFISTNQNNDFGLIWTIFFPVFVILIRSKSGIPHIVLFYTFLFTLAFINIGIWQNGEWALPGFIRLVAASTLLTYVVYVSELSRNQVDRKNDELLQREKEYNARLQEYQEHLEERVQKTLSELSEKEKIILRNAQLAEMGNLIGIIAHQLKQPLNAINLGVYDIQEANRYGELDDSYLTNATERVQKQVSHMSQTIDDFRDFFNPNKKKKRFNLSKTVGKTLDLLMPQMHQAGIEVIFKPDETIETYGYESELQQVLLNIIHNARDVFEENKVEAPKISIICRCDESTKQVGIHIEDNGGGIPEAVKERIFDSYFTTKEEAGTGIGLYLARKIVTENFQGRLEVENIANGARFSIYLPADREST